MLQAPDGVEVAAKDVPVVHTETKTITYESAEVNLNSESCWSVLERKCSTDWPKKRGTEHEVPLFAAAFSNGFLDESFKLLGWSSLLDRFSRLWSVSTQSAILSTAGLFTINNSDLKAAGCFRWALGDIMSASSLWPSWNAVCIGQANEEEKPPLQPFMWHSVDAELVYQENLNTKFGLLICNFFSIV